MQQPATTAYKVTPPWPTITCKRDRLRTLPTAWQAGCWGAREWKREGMRCLMLIVPLLQALVALAYIVDMLGLEQVCIREGFL